MAERGTSGYIPENEQVQEQMYIPEQRRQQEHASSGLRRIKQVGTLMFGLLAADLGIVAAAKTTDSHEPEVNPQTITNLINNSSYENSANPPTDSVPQSWTAGTSNNINVPAPHYDYGTAGFDGNSSVDTDGYTKDTSCNTDTNSWEQSFAVTPSNTYILSFANYIPAGSSSDLGPRAIITWKNGTTPLGFDDHTFNRNLGPDIWENDFSRTYGPSGVVIPTGTTSATLQVGVGSTKTNSCTVGTEGKQYFDVVTVMGPAPAPSVGGIAEAVDIKTLPANSHGNNNSNEMYVVIGGIVIGTLAAGAAGVKIRSIAKEQRK